MARTKRYWPTHSEREEAERFRGGDLAACSQMKKPDERAQ